MVSSEELIGTADYTTLYTRCRINRCRCNRIRLNLILFCLLETGNGARFKNILLLCKK
jgi:hypothetical protein